MGRRFTDMSAWLADSGVETQDHYLFLYNRVKARRNIYWLVFLGIPLFGYILEKLFHVETAFVGLCLYSFVLVYPFLYKACYLTNVFKCMDLSIEPNKIATIIMTLDFLGIIPFVLFFIINKTNWGMGLNNWDKAYEKAKKKNELKDLNN